MGTGIWEGDPLEANQVALLVNTLVAKQIPSKPVTAKVLSKHAKINLVDLKNDAQGL